MATNPYFTQYHTQRFSFIGSPQQRDGTQTHDQRFINMYPELIRSPISDGKKYYLKKRPGTSTFQSFPTGTSQGLYYWGNSGNYYTAINGILYSNQTAILTLASTTNPVGFTEYRDDNFDLLFVCDGIKGYTITQFGSVTTITDANFPSPHIPNPIFLDGYIFLVQANSQQIHNSKLQSPTVWPADGFLDAEMFPDNIVALAKVQNYIAAVGTNSIEWFYDNANATGSPLQRNAPAVSQFGAPAPATVNQTEREVILVGQTAAGGRTVWVIDGFQPTEIADAPIREALDYEGSSINNASAFTIQCAGHKWYVLNLGLAQRTLVYDFEEQMWHEWTYGTGGQQLFPYRFAADSGNGAPVLLGYSGGNTVSLSPNYYMDINTLINCVIITVKIDFDTIKRKRLYRLSIVGDGPNGNTPVPLLVSWSDDDYTTFVPDHTLMMGSGYSTITQLGYTRRRAFRFTYQQPYPLRLEAFEVDHIQEVRR